ncbi:hypothetical protein JW911_00480 [Candidatus Peregrinibacteria bacterium]|nr:hypothetical protein [Candidatus Peregrinibacteria bacterium]
MKKLALCVLAAAILMPVFTAHADYLDCDWRYHYGEPQMGECYYLINPGNRNSGNDNDVTTTSADDYFGSSTTSGYNNSDVTTSSASDYFGSSSSSGYNNSDVTTSSASDYFGNSSSSGYNNSDVTTSSASDYFGSGSSSSDSQITSSDDKYSDKFIKNYRDYCAGDYCWVIYDECYDNTHCWEKKERYPRNEYDPDYNAGDNNYSRNRGNTWNYWVNYVVNNYYMGWPTCDSRYQKCVYRGFHFGSYHNGYWWGR